MKGFTQFIMRGNALDLAVGVVTGAAFGTVISSLVKDILTPVVAALVHAPDFSALSFTINGSTILFGDFLNAVISFLIVAVAVYFFVVLPVNHLTSRMRKQPPPDPTTKKCPECKSVIAKDATRCAFCTSALPAN